ncbi:hypothetical protein GCM10022384_53760 [Streptomyces marokkonensis]|uniref:Uncharacterized protein n=1 Tax=Streptomyces marokkonensis TaxID=324855 RepID=A0ABP7RNF0_9ACTN
MSPCDRRVTAETRRSGHRGDMVNRHLRKAAAARPHAHRETRTTPGPHDTGPAGRRSAVGPVTGPGRSPGRLRAGPAAAAGRE